MSAPDMTRPGSTATIIVDFPLPARPAATVLGPEGIPSTSSGSAPTRAHPPESHQPGGPNRRGVAAGHRTRPGGLPCRWRRPTTPGPAAVPVGAVVGRDAPSRYPQVCRAGRG